MRQITDEQIAAAQAAVEQCGGNVSAAARLLGITRNAIRHRLSLASVPGTEAKAQPAPAAREATLADLVARQRAEDEAARARARLKESLQIVANLEGRLKDLEWAAHASWRPAEWTLRPRPGNAKSEHVPYLLTSDFQIGEVVRSEETDHADAYSTDIFRARYRRLIEATIYLSHEHTGAKWTYPGIIYARGGDTISGGIHDELAETDDLTPIEACEIAFEEEAAGIRHLLEAFGRVEVKDCGGGNHDRDTHKPRSKGATAHSFDRLISFMLRREFRNDDRVTFQTTQSPDVYFPIYGQNILLTHGDKIGSRGGQGFVGPAATVMRGAQKVIMEQAAIGRKVDRVDMGHFHTPMYLGWVLVNGTTVGYSEYAKMNRLRPSEPQQFLVYHHSQHGVVDLKPIKLGGTK